MDDVRVFLQTVSEHKEDRDYQILAHGVAEAAYRKNKELFRLIVMEDETMTGTLIDLVEDQVREREKEVERRMQAEIADKDKQLEEKDSRLREQSSQLEEKDSRLREQSSQLKEKDEEIRFLKKKLSHMDEIFKKANIAIF